MRTGHEYTPFNPSPHLKPYGVFYTVVSIFLVNKTKQNSNKKNWLEAGEMWAMCLDQQEDMSLVPSTHIEVLDMSGGCGGGVCDLSTGEAETGGSPGLAEWSI